MRHALYDTTDGKIWLCQVLLFNLLQGLLCSGRVVLVPQEGSYHRMWLLRHRDPLQEDEKNMAASATQQTSTAATTTTAGSPLPVLRDMAFIPRQRQNEPLSGRSDPIFVNISRESNSSLDYQIWKALLSKALHRNMSHSALTSQLPVPHLKHLGFGASNKLDSRPQSSSNLDHSSEDNVQITEHHEDSEYNRQDLRKLVFLGLGSFMGGISVIMCILLVIIIRRRCRKRDVYPSDIGANEADPKLTLIANEAPVPLCSSVVDTINEYSSTTNSSSSSGSGETSSNTSDNASHSTEYGEVWTVPPNQIALTTINHVSRRSSSASVYEQITSNTKIQREEQCPLLDPIPDLLLSNTLIDLDHEHSPHVECISEEGGIIMPQSSDVVLIVPPGAVDCPTTIAVKLHSIQDYPEIRYTTEELVISPIIEVSANDLEHFTDSLTIKLPYRNLPCCGPCSCEDDPLCSCAGSRVELRYCDISTSGQAGNWRRSHSQSVGGCYVWPECFSPENIQRQQTSCKDFGNALVSRLQRSNSSVSHKRADSRCQIKTNAPGLYGLVWIPGNRQEPWTQYSGIEPRSQSSSKGHGTSIQMCAMVSVGPAKDADSMLCDADNRGPPQFVYTVHITDNTADSKQILLVDIERCCRQAVSGFVPVDIHSGSSVTVCLSSVHDPTWPCTLPQADSLKRVPWSAICRDFGSPSTVDFLCIPKNGGSSATRSEMLTVFDIEIVESCRDELRLSTKRLVAYGICQ